MGFYAKYFSTFLRGPLSLRIKERLEVNSIERFGSKLEKLQKDFPRLTEEEHRITQFLKELRALIEDIRKMGGNCFNLLFNELLKDMGELEEVDLLFKELTKLPIRKQVKGAEEQFLAHIAAALGSEDIREREEYRQVEAIINEAKNFKNDRESFIAWLRTSFKTKAKLRGLLERASWKMSISASSRELNRTKDVARKLKKLAASINEASHKDPASEGTWISLLEKELKTGEGDIINMFKTSYLVKERALLMLLKLLYTAEQVDLYLQNLVQKNLIPRGPAEEERQKLADTIGTLGENIHKTIAQEFRIVIHKLESEKAKAPRLAMAG